MEHENLSLYCTFFSIFKEHCARYEVVCTEKIVSVPICRPKNTNCQVREIEHACVKDKLPNNIDLKQTFCDKCVNGKRTIRPIHGEKYVCRDVKETFCANVTQPKNLRPNWKKWCQPNDDSHLNYKIHKEIASLTTMANSSGSRVTVSQNIKKSVESQFGIRMCISLLAFFC